MRNCPGIRLLVEDRTALTMDQCAARAVFRKTCGRNTRTKPAVTVTRIRARTKQIPFWLRLRKDGTCGSIDHVFSCVGVRAGGEGLVGCHVSLCRVRALLAKRERNENTERNACGGFRDQLSKLCSVADCGASSPHTTNRLLVSFVFGQAPDDPWRRCGNDCGGFTCQPPVRSEQVIRSDYTSLNACVR